MARLLDAAAAELREVGPDVLTVRSVAGRAGVSAATAYTYVASKHHLLAELFWRALVEGRRAPTGTTRLARVRSVTHDLVDLLLDAPELAAGATAALLGSDPDVGRLRLRIGAELWDLFRAALGEDADQAVLETLVLAFSGALLQAGMGLMTYAEMGERLDAVVAVIMRGQP